MLEVKNKKVIREIATTTYRANKKRNLLAVFAMILTTFLIAVVMAVGISYWSTISERQIRMQGMDYDIELSEPKKSQTEKIRSLDIVQYAGVAVKCAVLEQYQGKRLDKIRIYWLDETCWEKQAVPALESYEGNYPQHENEMMLGKNTLKTLGIQNPKIGMKIPLTYATLAKDSKEELFQKDFVLCGWYTDYSGAKRGYISDDFFKTTGVKQTDFTQGSLKITLKNPLYSQKDIVKIQNAISLERNQYISADYDTISNFCKTAVGLVILLLLIFTSGYLFIYNTLYISISKDIRYYGQLKTIGMTSVQLKHMIRLQAAWNSLIGIPLGLLAAALTAKIGIPQFLSMVNPIFSAEDIVLVRPWIFLLAGGFALFANWIGCKQPAKMVGECSAVEALRYTASGRQKNQKRERCGIYSMAWQNLFRDKKQAAVIFLSFTIAISIFLVINVVIRGNDAKRILNEVYSYDLQFKNETTLDDDRQQLLTENKISQIKEIKGVKDVRKVTSAEAVVPYQETVYGGYYKALYQSRYSPGNYEEDMKLYRKDPKLGYFTARFISVDKRGFQILSKHLQKSLDWQDFEKGKYAVAVKYFTQGDHGIPGKTVRFSLPDGKNPTKEHSISIVAVGDAHSNPAFFSGGITPDLIVSESYAKKLISEPFTELIYVEYQESFSEETERKVKAVLEKEKRISYDSKLERYFEMKNSEIQIKILGNSLGFIIAMLAVLNYLNTMAASVQNRAKEFAALESIGMTTGQIRKMLRTEGIAYAGISTLLSFAVGLPISYTVFQGMNVYRLSFSVPWMRNLILFAIVFLLCITAPVLIYQRTQNLSIIDRMRRGQD